MTTTGCEICRPGGHPGFLVIASIGFATPDEGVVIVHEETCMIGLYE